MSPTAKSLIALTSVVPRVSSREIFFARYAVFLIYWIRVNPDECLAVWGPSEIFQHTRGRWLNWSVDQS